MPPPQHSEPVATAATSAQPSGAVTCPPVRPIGLGAISGRVTYPAEGSPPLAIYAFRVGDPSVYRVIHTPLRGPSEPQAYTMAAVEPGMYVVLAYVAPQKPDLPSGPLACGLCGGYTVASVCGLGQQCNNHSLLRVTVRAGETVSGIDVTDWYAPDGIFPTRPAFSAGIQTADGLQVCNPYADSVNMRASAGLGFPVRRTIDNGARVVVRDGPLGADGYDWYEVNLAGDQLASGWVIGYALRK